MAPMTTDIRYPIGPWDRVAPSDDAARSAAIEAFVTVPQALREAVAGLSDAQLDTPYRDGGWSPRQICHHLADSHMNSFLRFKFGLTEDTPTIKPYDENAWSTTPDVLGQPVEHSLQILSGVHARLVALLRAQPAAAFDRGLLHPERGPMTLAQLLGLYAWHGAHHIAQITAQRQRNGW